MSSFQQDPYLHIGGFAAIGIGILAWYSTGLAHDPSTFALVFMVGGLSVQGVKIANNIALSSASTAAAAISNMAIAVAQQQVIDTQAAAVKVIDIAAIQQTARAAASATAAQVISDTAAQVAHDLPPVVR
jgi:hypothetical protein